ncbi:phospholipase A2 inhibitor and Ly6/PLAUR domain-containing protein-like [Ranitomeya variabilis]|uniref:phospholipase A2 inhibitor and Ly6/PLAUR domain-containing protein-like n=1 Tax=Ranitomeya variabilis TaxID=490064 RepID=UPI0040561E2F
MMSSPIGILSLLSTLSATSYALSCTQCVSTSASCAGSIVTCRSGYTCGSSYTETVVGATTEVSFIRSCVAPAECSFNGSLSIQQGYIRMGISCCNSDNCDPTIPSLPSRSSVLNGQVCRTCISADSTWCYTSDTLQCTGDENMCLLETTKISGSQSSSVAIRGCSTKSICDLGSQSQTVGDISVEVKFICTSGGRSVHKLVLTPVISCLLLLKLFY